MGILDETRSVERLQFFNGQQLFASDLQGIDAFNREMSWLHKRSLHQPGVGNGFAVYANKGDREVTVQPGYAVDSQGREIVLLDTHVEQIPPVSSEPDGQSVFYDLTVAYPEDSDLEKAETRDGICLPRGVVRRREAPVFCWVRLKRDADNNLRVASTKLAQDIQQGLKIVLARAEVLNCQLNQGLSIAQRRNARPAKQPYIACGTQPADWSPWEIEGGGLEEQQKFIIGLLARIETATAGFLTTPCYSARIDGPRPKIFLRSELNLANGEDKPLEVREDEPNLAAREDGQDLIIIDGQMYIQDPRPDGFTAYLVVLPFRGDRNLITNPNVIEWVKQNWRVLWMGIEG